jgi:hypothetical protein
LTIPAVLLALCLFSGCLDKYSAEKELWNVYILHARTIHEPVSAGTTEFEETVRELRKVVKDHPDYENAPYILTLIRRLYAQRSEKYKREVSISYEK